MAKEYGIWLSYNNQEEGFELPVLPSEIGITRSGDGADYEVYGLGKINAIKSAELAEIKIESVFLAGNAYGPLRQRVPFVTSDRTFDPRYYIAHIQSWQKKKRPIRFVYVGSTIDINLAVSIESFKWKEVAGSPGTIEYTLELKEYRFYAPRKVEVKKASSGTTTAQKKPASRASDKETPKTYSVISGDSLWKIAQKTLGKGDRWREIQKLNGLTDAQAKNLKIGQKLKIPTT